jgi:anti-anti-sigma factor
VVAVAGELNPSSAEALDAQLEELLSDSGPLVILDLRALEFMDSTGLRSVVIASKRAKQRRRDFAVLVEGSGQVHSVLSRTGVLGALTVMAPEDVPA